ncbi:MAG: secretin N-terminal domain-containing protein [Spirochaetota bacterium]
MNKKILALILTILFFSLSLINLSYTSSGFTQDTSAKKAPPTFALNFNDVEISEFINVMSRILGKNIILSDKVKGKITISSAKRVPVDDAFDLMKSILEIKGFAVVETQNLIKIVPVKEAIKKNVEVIVDGDEINLENDDTVTVLIDITNTGASDILNVLRTLKSPETDIVLFAPLNTLIFSGNSGEINGLIKIATTLDKKAATIKDPDYDKLSQEGNIHVVHLENADAVKLAEVLSRIPFSENAKINTQRMQAPPSGDKRPGVDPQQSNVKLSIIANKETNSLLISASPEEFREIHAIVKQLDSVRPQVLIEATIVEVNAESSWGLGIDWSLAGESGIHQFGGSSVMGSVPSYSTPSGLSGKTLAVPLNPGAMTIGYISDTSILNFALLNASGTDKNINILSTPHILTIDNHEAEINVAEEIAVPTNSRITDENTVYYTFEYKSVGLKLKITPHINRGNMIALELFTEVNSILGETKYLTSGTIIPPDLGKRDMKTKVAVPDGETIVVGGLMRNQKVETETKVPILGDIPLLGWFFKSKSSENTKTNLLIFITPRVVTESDKIKAITEEKQAEMKKIQDSYKK